MDTKRTLKDLLHKFSQSTTLHGYNYFTNNVVNSKILKWTWVAVLFAISVLGIGLFVKNTDEFLRSRLQTNIESSTEPLDVSLIFKSFSS